MKARRVLINKEITQSFAEGVIDDASNFYLSIKGDEILIEVTEDNYTLIRDALKSIEAKSKNYRSLAKKWLEKLDLAWIEHTESMDQEETENISPRKVITPKTVGSQPQQKKDKEIKDSKGNQYHLLTKQDVTNYEDEKEMFKKEIEPRSIEARRYEGIGVPQKNSTYNEILKIDAKLLQEAVQDYINLHREVIAQRLADYKTGSLGFHPSKDFASNIKKYYTAIAKGDNFYWAELLAELRNAVSLAKAYKDKKSIRLSKVEEPNNIVKFGKKLYKSITQAYDQVKSVWLKAKEAEILNEKKAMNNAKQSPQVEKIISFATKVFGSKPTESNGTYYFKFGNKQAEIKPTTMGNVWIDFRDPTKPLGKQYTHVGKEMEAGAKEFAWKLREFVRGMKDLGLGIRFKATPRRAELYSRILSKEGFEGKVKGGRGAFNEEEINNMRYKLINNKLFFIVNAGEVTAYKKFLDKFEDFKNVMKVKVAERGSSYKKGATGLAYEKAVALIGKLKELLPVIKTGTLGASSAKLLEEQLAEARNYLSGKGVGKLKIVKETPELQASLEEVNDSLKGRDGVLSKFTRLLKDFAKRTGKTPIAAKTVGDLQGKTVFSQLVRYHIALEQKIKMYSKKKKLPSGFEKSYDLGEDLRQLFNDFNTTKEKYLVLLRVQKRIEQVQRQANKYTKGMGGEITSAASELKDVATKALIEIEGMKKKLNPKRNKANNILAANAKTILNEVLEIYTKLYRKVKDFLRENNVPRKLHPFWLYDNNPEQLSQEAKQLVKLAVTAKDEDTKDEVYDKLNTLFNKIRTPGVTFVKGSILAGTGLKQDSEIRGLGFELYEKGFEAKKYIESRRRSYFDKKYTGNKLLQGENMNKFNKRSETIKYIIANSEANEADEIMLANMSNNVLKSIAQSIDAVQNMSEDEYYENMDEEYSEMMDYENMEYNEDDDETEIMDIATLAEKFGIDPNAEDVEEQLKEMLSDLLNQLEGGMDKEEEEEEEEEDDEEMENMDYDMENMDYEENMDDEMENMDYDMSKNRCSSTRNGKADKPKKRKMTQNNSANYLGSALLPTLNKSRKNNDDNYGIPEDDVYESPTLGY